MRVKFWFVILIVFIIVWGAFMFMIGLKGVIWFEIKFIFIVFDCLLFFLFVLNNWLRLFIVIVRFCFVIRLVGKRVMGLCLLSEDEKLGNVFFLFIIG